MRLNINKYNNINELKNTIMKKILLAIAAVATITGCSQSEEFENPGQKAEINC